VQREGAVEREWVELQVTGFGCKGEEVGEEAEWSSSTARELRLGPTRIPGRDPPVGGRVYVSRRASDLHASLMLRPQPHLI